MPGQAEQASGELVCRHIVGAYKHNTTLLVHGCSAVLGLHQYASQHRERYAKLCAKQKHPISLIYGAILPSLHCVQVSYGESHKVVGGHPSLGDWDVSNAPQMQWNDGNVWTLEVQLPEGSDIEFKVSAKTCMSGQTCIFD